MVLKVVSLKGLCKNNEVLIGFPCVFIVLGLDILLSHLMTTENKWRNCHNECLGNHYCRTLTAERGVAATLDRFWGFFYGVKGSRHLVFWSL